MSHPSSSLGFSVAFYLSPIINQPLSEASGGEAAAYSATPPSSSPQQTGQRTQTTTFHSFVLSLHPVMPLHPLHLLLLSLPSRCLLSFSAINGISTADYFVYWTCYWRCRAAPTYGCVNPSGEPGFNTISDRLWAETLLSIVGNLVNLSAAVQIIKE